MSLGLASVLYGLYVVRVSISLAPFTVLYGSLFCPIFYVASVCIGLYVVRVSMSLGLTPVLYGSLCCPSFYVTWSHFRYVWFSVFSKFLCHLISLPFCMGLYVVRVSMSLNFTSILYVLLCCPSFQVTCSHFRFVWFSMFLYWFSFIFMFVIVLIIMADRSFLAHLAKGNVSICHHLASVVR